MGYKTEYTLYVHNNIEGDMMDHQVNIKMLMSNEDLFGPSGCIWSDHETFMKRYSMKYPNTILNWMEQVILQLTYGENTFEMETWLTP